MLVEEAALERAEAECLADAEARARRREREERRRSEQDVDFQAKLARAIIKLYPAARESAQRRSPAMPAPGGVAASAAPPPRAPSTPRRSRSRS